MRILAFTDVHANEAVLDVLKQRAKEADLIICAGDVALYGSGLEESLAEMDSWGKPIMLIHGNEPHEDEEVFSQLIPRHKNIQFIHGKEIAVGDISLVGWGGGGFATSDPELEAFAKHLAPKPGRVFVMHGPPQKTALDKLEGMGHVGCSTRRAVLEKLQPFLALCGHLHENFGKSDRIGNCLVLNPGPIGKYIEVNAKKTDAKKPAASTQRIAPKTGASRKKK